MYAMALEAAREDAEGLNDSYRQFNGKSWPKLWLDTRQEPPRLPEEASMLRMLVHTSHLRRILPRCLAGAGKHFDAGHPAAVFDAASLCLQLWMLKW